jgi:hypothetical protein
MAAGLGAASADVAGREWTASDGERLAIEFLAVRRSALDVEQKRLNEIRAKIDVDALSLTAEIASRCGIAPKDLRYEEKRHVFFADPSSAINVDPHTGSK